MTLIHTVRLGITNKQAQLHCEPLPPTPGGVREFVRKWTTVPYGTAGEGGRRVDAIVLGGGWECESPSVTLDKERDAVLSGKPTGQPDWTPSQYHFHLIHSLLPALLKAPAERNIRIVELVSPAWSAAMPGIKAGLEGKPHKPETGPVAAAARRGVTTLLVQDHFRLVLDTLASAAFSTKKPVPSTEDEQKPARQRDEDIHSNIMALSVVMPWARDEVLKPVWGAGTFIHALLWILLYPLIVLLTPSPAKSVQSVLFALSAPVKYPGDLEAMPNPPPVLGAEAEKTENDKPKKVDDDEITDPRRNGITQGDVVRDCATIEWVEFAASDNSLPPVLHDPLLARATYEKVQGEVEAGVKAYEARLKAETEAAEKAREAKGSKVKFADE